jgi:hypothetical protein
MPQRLLLDHLLDVVSVGRRAPAAAEHARQESRGASPRAASTYSSIHSARADARIVDKGALRSSRSI